MPTYSVDTLYAGAHPRMGKVQFPDWWPLWIKPDVEFVYLKLKPSNSPLVVQLRYSEILRPLAAMLVHEVFYSRFVLSSTLVASRVASMSIRQGYRLSSIWSRT